MLQDVKRGLLFTMVTMVLFGGLYPMALWAVGRVVFPAQAEGSLIRSTEGKVLGSTLIAQRFDQPGYFHPRPSGVDFNAASSGGTNDGPSNPEHLKAVRQRLDALVAAEGVPASRVPSEMVTASGGGLDPHIPPDAAELQINRVAAARGAEPSRVRELLARHIEPPTLGFLGRARVNVLELNVALDRELGIYNAATPAGKR
ncbi:MAG TPA: potassium-transporting ATPase subunit KdpC [Patescibacteria group bacterium]|nr:potassium-transporting ATPase subunit KdpC [Patescibacteria group bacterium]